MENGNKRFFDIYLEHLDRILQSEREPVSPSVISNYARQCRAICEGYESIGQIQKISQTPEQLLTAAKGLAKIQGYLDDVILIPEVSRNYVRDHMLELHVSSWIFEIYARKGEKRQPSESDGRTIEYAVKAIVEKNVRTKY